MKKYILIASFGILAILGASYFTLQVFGKPTIIHSADIADFRDDRALIGASHDVYVGKVLKKGDTIIVGESLPATVFQVEVIDVIKGDKKGTIEVAQLGGCIDARCVVMSGDVAHEAKRIDDIDQVLMSPGLTYVLSSRHDDIYGDILIPNIAGRVLISSDSKTLKENKRYKDLKKAYTEEIVFEGDIKLGWDKNSFSKLSPDEKKKILSEIKEMR